MKVVCFATTADADSELSWIKRWDDSKPVKIEPRYSHKH